MLHLFVERPTFLVGQNTGSIELMLYLILFAPFLATGFEGFRQIGALASSTPRILQTVAISLRLRFTRSHCNCNNESVCQSSVSKEFEWTKNNNGIRRRHMISELQTKNSEAFEAFVGGPIWRQSEATRTRRHRRNFRSAVDDVTWEKWYNTHTRVQHPTVCNPKLSSVVCSSILHASCFSIIWIL